VLEFKKDKEKAVEKEQGTRILPGAEHDELEASEIENISGGTPATTTPPVKDYFLNLSGIAGESSDH